MYARRRPASAALRCRSQLWLRLQACRARVTYECVRGPPACVASDYEYLETIFESSSQLHPSERPHWILNCSEAVKSLARDRVYELQRTQTILAAPPPPAAQADVDGGPYDGANKRQRLDDSAAGGAAGSAAGGGSSAARSAAGNAADGAADSHSASHSAADGAAAASESADGSAARSALGVSASVAPVAGAKAAPPLSVRCVLEESPKWAALVELMDEIRTQRAARAKGGTLLVVRDERASWRSRSVVTSRTALSLAARCWLTPLLTQRPMDRPLGGPLSLPARCGLPPPLTQRPMDRDGCSLLPAGYPLRSPRDTRWIEPRRRRHRRAGS
jgi:hypothetical protein